MIHTTTSESPKILLREMACDLSASNDPWARHWLILPGQGRSEWLLRDWASLRGLASRSQIVELRSLTQMTMAGQESFSLSKLTMAIAGALPQVANILPLSKKSISKVIDGKMLSWAGKIASVVDESLLCRENLHQDKSTFIQGLLSIPEIKKTLSRHIGLIPEAQIEKNVLQWLSSWQKRGGVPKIWLQLDAGVPEVLMRRLNQLLNLLPEGCARLYLLVPTLQYWIDMKTGKRKPEDKSEDPGTLLRAFGRRSQDMQVQGMTYFLSEGGGRELEPCELSQNILGRMKESCRLIQTPSEKGTLSEVADDSFSVHSCRTALRELEVCRDRILQAMHEIPDLKPEQILLLFANPSKYSPLLRAALQPQSEVSLHIPFRLLSQESTVSLLAEGISSLMKMLSGRMRNHEVIGLLEHPLVAKKFGLDGEEQEIAEWLIDSNFRWGLDGKDRESVQKSEEPCWSLDFALRRLALGAVVDRELRDGVVDKCAPLDRASGISTLSLAKLAIFAQALKKAKSKWGVERELSLDEWCEQTQELVETFFDEGQRQEKQQRVQLLQTLLPSLKGQACDGPILKQDAFARLLSPLLDKLSEGYGVGSGGVTVADLRQYAGTPARMILIAGLGKENFPRKDEKPDWHPLKKNRHPGDPNFREEDRHNLLLSLMACSERLVLTYEGGSDMDARELPPSTPLADMLEAVEDCGVSQRSVLYKHGLNGFSPQAHLKDNSLMERSFLNQDTLGAQCLAQPHSKAPSGLWSTALSMDRVSLIPRRDLKNLFKIPSLLFTQRLGLRLAHEEDELDACDPIDLDPLQSWKGIDRLLDLRLEGGDEAALKERAFASGELPSKDFGENQWQTYLEKTPSLKGRVKLQKLDPWVCVDGVKFDASPIKPWYINDEERYVCYSASKLTKKDLSKKIQFQIDLLFQAKNHGVKELDVVSQSVNGKPAVMTLHAPLEENIDNLLRRLIQLHQVARSIPMPYSDSCYDKIQEVGLKNNFDAEACCGVVHGVWDGSSSFGKTISADSEKASNRISFRGLDAMAWLGEKNCEALKTLPHPGEPLVWRMSEAVREWQELYESEAGE